jgi:DNA polymerase I-like protein with 3'-5' exonuclease and polymerase domains
MKGCENRLVYVYDFSQTEEDIIQVIEKSDVLVAFNAKFELLYLWSENRLQEWFQKGGRVYCPQLAEYFLTSMQTKFAGLRDLSVYKYGLKERQKLMEPYWENGVDTCDIPRELVLEDCDADTEDTLGIYNLQQEDLKTRSVTFQNFLDVQMDFLLSTCEIEYNGLCVSKEVLNRNSKELEEELLEVNKELESLVERYWVYD